MAKATKVQRQGRRVVPAIRKTVARAKGVQLTLGDLIAAAFDAVGNEARAVACVLGSANMTRATGKKLVFV